MTEHLNSTRYIKEETLLPAHYTPANEPFYQGKGNHSVSTLEELCEQYKEFVHQMRIREQTLLKECDVVIVGRGQKFPSCSERNIRHIVSNGNICSECGEAFGAFPQSPPDKTLNEGEMPTRMH